MILSFAPIDIRRPVRFQRPSVICCFLIATVLFAQCCVFASSVRLAFLDDEPALQDTIGLLTNSVCSAPVAIAYQNAVRSNVFDRTEFALSRLPTPSAGFYSFATVWDLVKALPQNAFESSHAASFNCFDTLILLADGQLQCSLHPDDLSGPYLVPKYYTNGLGTTVMETPRDAYNENYPLAYTQTAECFFPKSKRDSRICLTAALYRQHCLPASTTSETCAVTMLEVLRAAWRRAGLKFPDKCELVMVHGVKSFGVCSDHAGLLIPHGGTFTYVEKIGGSGPFVRFDFNERTDLTAWLSAIWQRCQVHENHFVTINDARIEKLYFFTR